jgi:hypothetical protein
VPRSYSSAGLDDAVSTEGITFELDGVEFTCHGRISAFDLSEFAGPAADAGEDMLDPGVMRILADMMRAVLGEVTYRDLRRHRQAHKTPDGVMQQILEGIVEDAANRPSAGLSPSPAGPPAPAGLSLAAASPSPAAKRRRPQDHLPKQGREGRASAAAAATRGRVVWADAPPAGPAVPSRPGRVRRLTIAGQVVTEEPGTGTG